MQHVLMVLTQMVVQLVLTAMVQGRRRRNRPMTSSRLEFDQDRPTRARPRETNTRLQDMPFIGHGVLHASKDGADVLIIIAETIEATPLL